ncbi:MAG: bifunctional ornithine acetyltransferase/N-acetylglutamate synthase [Candidatus Margulisbacteria bacterium GWF2_35_9]|nr:MAG: bifunctional ornithine acetyltransferase/N-acetylglutamate synthase [Candidatus Margulisbacteria bacterium GWF2_35_9]
MDKVNGFLFAGINCGIKQTKKDLGLVYIKDGATFAGATTRNLFASPTIRHTKEILKNKNNVYSVLVNSGNANALTGAKGYNDINDILASLGSITKQPPHSAVMLSTGIIGKRLPVDTIKKGIPILMNELDASCNHFATAICTTDTKEKVFSKKITINNKTVSVLGIAKGSGMIQPNLATMLAFIFTDACIDQQLLQSVIIDAANNSFNRITVDSDSSTNDSFLLFASNKGVTIDKSSIEVFKEAVEEIALKLAKEIIIDGEGATKFVELTINSAKNDEEARAIFYAIANSPLVKTALFGENPNFGRILCSAGKIKSSIIPEKVVLKIGEHILYRDGEVADYNLTKLNAYMKNKNIQICLDLNIGKTNFTGWTTDLSHDYVDINAKYT